MGKYVQVANCPTPEKLAPLLETIGRETGAWPNSVYRGDDVAVLLHAVGKHTQRELYEMWINHVPGALPANPPTQGTHILKSDGVAYLGPPGRPLFYWQVGLDYNDSVVMKVKAQAAQHGWIMFQPYPTGSEYHHLNLSKEPRIHVFKPLKKGSHGPRVTRLTKKLCFIHRPERDETYMTHTTSEFGDGVLAAVKQFQRDHKLPDDGVVGDHTKRQLKASVKHEKRSRQIAGLRDQLTKAIADRNKAKETLDNLERAEHPDPKLKRKVEANLAARKHLVADLERKIREAGGDPHPKGDNHGNG